MEGMLRERVYSSGVHFMVDFKRRRDGWTWRTHSPCGLVSFMSYPLHHADIKQATAHAERSLDEGTKVPGRWATDGVRYLDEVETWPRRKGFDS